MLRQKVPGGEHVAVMRITNDDDRPMRGLVGEGPARRECAYEDVGDRRILDKKPLEVSMRNMQDVAFLAHLDA